MRRRLLLACLACAALVPAAPAAARVPPGWMGVVASETSLLADPALWSSETAVMARSGVGTVRLPLYWYALEPSRGALDLRLVDQLVAGAARRRLRLLPTVLGTPHWASPGGGVADPPSDPADYASLLRRLVARYGPAGSLWAEHPELPRVPIRAWQVWNEPNLRQYWAPSRWAPGYVRLLRAARRALRAADPGARVVLAGLPNDSWNQLRLIHRAGGAGLFDVAAVHAYTATPDRVRRILERDRRELDTHRGRRVGLLVSEMGWSSGGARVHPPAYVTWNTTERGQARRLEQVYRTLAAVRVRLRVLGAYWYSWYTPERPRSPHWEDYTGLRRLGAGGRPVSKPALAAYARLARALGAR